MPTEWESGQECFDWWIGNTADESDEMDGQIEIEDSEGESK
jgi:hypothetical protein